MLRFVYIYILAKACQLQYYSFIAAGKTAQGARRNRTGAA